MERIDDLGINELRLIQDTDLFCFGIDSVLLTDFIKVKKSQNVVDLCTGNGIIPILLSAKTDAKKIYALEIQEPSYNLAVRNVMLNNLTDKITVILDDVKNSLNHFAPGSVDVITCNPPYMTGKMGFISPFDQKAAARHEIFITLDDILSISSKLLKYGGHFFMVHRCDRLVDILCTMRKYTIEPKRIRFIHPEKDKAPNLILVDGMLGGNAALKTEPPLYVQ